MTHAGHHPLPSERSTDARKRGLSAAVWLLAIYDRYLQRHALAELDDALLRDIGLTPEDVRRECAKPFWR